MFNLADYIVSSGVDYIERGPNVKKGDLNLTCPFCPNDPSKHLGINKTTGKWSCWRCGNAGVRPHRLLARLFGMSIIQVEGLVGGEAASATPLSALKEKVAKLNAPKEEAIPFSFQVLEYPKDFRSDPWNGSVGYRFWDFLSTRYRFEEDASKVWEQYDLKWAVTGEFAWRLIIPIKYRGDLIGWTGRAIAPSEIRYRTFPYDETTRHFVFNYDAALAGGKVLFVGEGPINMMKLDFFGRPYGCNAVATMGGNFSDLQILLINSIAQRYDKVMLAGDNDSTGERFCREMRRVLPRYQLSRLKLEVVKDWGDESKLRTIDAIMAATGA